MQRNHNPHTLLVSTNSFTPSVYPREMKIYAHTNTCMLTFKAALFKTDKKWKQLNIHQLMNRQIIEYTYSGLLFGNKKEYGV